MGGGIARVDCACMCRVAQTRVRRVVADCGCIFLWYFVRRADDCGGGCDGKEVDMEMILCVAFCAFIVGIAVGSTLVYCFLSAREDKILESTNELCDSCGKTLVETMDKMYEYGQKIKQLEEKQIKDYFDSHNGGVVSPNKHGDDFITRSETVVDINKMKDVFEKEQQKQ